MLKASIPQIPLAQYLISANRNLRNDTDFSSMTPMTRDQNPASERTSGTDFSTAEKKSEGSIRGPGGRELSPILGGFDVKTCNEPGAHVEAKDATETTSSRSRNNESEDDETAAFRDLLKQSMARRQDFENTVRAGSSSWSPPPRIQFQRRTPTSFQFGASAPGDEMTPAQTPAPSPEMTDDEVDQLELSVGRLGLNNGNGGGSPANEEYDDDDEEQEEESPDESPIDSDDGSRNEAKKLTAEDLDVLKRATKILSSQLDNFDAEINANIRQQIKELYKGWPDPPDVADMDSKPDFYLRGNEHAPVAINRTIQVLCAVERGINSLLELHREKGGDESFMEICVKRPVSTTREMDSAISAIGRTFKHGKSKKEEWMK